MLNNYFHVLSVKLYFQNVWDVAVLSETEILCLYRSTEEAQKILPLFSIKLFPWVS